MKTLPPDPAMDRIDAAAKLLWAYLGPTASRKLGTARQASFHGRDPFQHPAVIFLRFHALNYDETNLIFPKSIAKWRAVKAEVLALLTNSAA